MTHRPVRSLAALLAVLMVLFAFPALPIFAAGNVTSITIVVPEGVNEFTLYDGSDSEALYFSNADTYEDLVLEGEVQTPASIKINGLDYTLTKNGERSFTFKPNSGSFIGSVRLGILADSDKLSYKATGQGQSDITKSLNLTVADSWGLGELYYIEEVLQFGRGDFSKFNGEVTMTFSVPEKEYTVTYTKAPAFTLYDKDGNEKRSPITVKTSELTDGKNYEFQIGLNSGYTDRVPNVSYYMGDDHTSKQLGGTYSAGKYKYKIENVNGDIELFIDIMAPVSVTWSVQDTKGNPLSTGAQVRATQNVPFGGDLKFTVTAMLGYSVSGVTVNGTSQNITLKADSAEKSSDEQTVTSVTESQQIVVTVDKVKVTAYGGTGYSVAINQESTKVDGGWVELAKDFEVEVKLEDGFTDAKPTVTVNGRQYTDATPEEDGVTYKFNVSAVGAPTTVTVNGVSKNIYTVTLPDSTGMYIVSPRSLTASHGDTVTFTVTLREGYQHSASAEKEYKDLFTEAEGIEKIEYSEFDRTFTVTLKVTKDTGYTINGEKITKITYTVNEDGQHGEGYSFAGGSVDWGKAATFTVKPDTGYYITGIEYTVGDDATPISLDAKNGVNFSYSIQNVQGNIKVRVTCVAIKVKVTYTYPDVDFYGLTIKGSSETETYTYGESSEQLKYESGLKLTPKTAADEKIKGLKFDGWRGADGVTVDEQIALSASQCDANGEISITLTALLTANIFDEASENGAGKTNAVAYVNETEHRADNEAKKIVMSAKFSSALEGAALDSVSSEIKVLKVGMLYSNNDSLVSSTFTQYKDKIRDMTESGFVDAQTANDSHIYAFVNVVDNFDFNKDTYTQKVNLSKATKNETRYGCLFFVAQIGQQTAIFFGEVHNLKYEVAE